MITNSSEFRNDYFCFGGNVRENSLHENFTIRPGFHATNDAIQKWISTQLDIHGGAYRENT